MPLHFILIFFFFNDTATTEIYTLSLHDALPICQEQAHLPGAAADLQHCRVRRDRKSTRLNSSHQKISYAAFCLKKKKKNKQYELAYIIARGPRQKIRLPRRP